MTEIVMPRLSDTMEEGTILRWIKHDGEQVARGEELVEIETDKAAMVYESDAEGILRIVAGEGETLPVGAAIAHVGPGTEQDGGGSGVIAHVGAETERDGGGTQDDGRARDSEPQAATKHAKPTPSAAIVTRDEPRVKASPLARRVARERGLDLHEIAGSGPGGRIVRADVEAEGAATPASRPTAATRPTAQPAATRPAAAQPAAATRPTAQPAATRLAAGEPPVLGEPPPAAATLAERVATAKGETTTVELTRLQQTVARRMAESKATIPDFTLQVDIDMEACVALRGELKRLSPEEAPTYNDMVVKACALALREHPRANGSYRDGRLQLHERVNVGVAVAVEQDNPGIGGGEALVVPTVFDADRKALGEIARETRTLVERVRTGAITPPELGGATFTVSNLGMYGVRSFTAIVNPPQAGILAVGSLEPRPVVRDGQLVARHTLAVTLACDHRVLYGADAARFGARIRALLEEPAALTL
ncbi:MAG TPA: dihydrolipoamide acetyltransferase family protein [Solirubrobacteraceae bacterium]|nr:dihydrolipoamide acetyltransferase family protein [Solirubrobacteraceae bacterium]